MRKLLLSWTILVPPLLISQLFHVFPEKFDVVQVHGEEEEWFGQVTSVSERDKTVLVQPLIANVR